jgi:hypothetical protein
MPKIKLSFKKDPNPTGLSSVGNPHPNTNIKINKKVVGTIYGPTWRSEKHTWKICLSIEKNYIMEDGNPNCTWKNVVLKVDFETEKDARIWLKENIDRLNNKYKFHFLEEDL